MILCVFFFVAHKQEKNNRNEERLSRCFLRRSLYSHKELFRRNRRIIPFYSNSLRQTK